MVLGQQRSLCAVAAGGVRSHLFLEKAVAPPFYILGIQLVEHVIDVGARPVAGQLVGREKHFLFVGSEVFVNGHGQAVQLWETGSVAVAGGEPSETLANGHFGLQHARQTVVFQGPLAMDDIGGVGVSHGVFLASEVE